MNLSQEKGLRNTKGIQPNITEATNERARDPQRKALAIRKRLNTLKGEAREAFIEKYREMNKGKIFVAFHMHDHQPVYRPGVNAADTPEYRKNVMESGDADNRRQVYKEGEGDFVNLVSGDKKSFPNAGVQVSFSGSLIQNMDETAQRGEWPGVNWNNTYREIRNDANTILGNPMLDFVKIGYHHPLMGLIATGHSENGVNPDKDIEIQIKMHDVAIKEHFGGPISSNLFPPEMAFSERMIPALKKVGVKSVQVDNIHFDRANQDYHNPQDGLVPPNIAEKRNSGHHQYEMLSNDVNKRHMVSPEALRPHYAKFVDPVSGNEELMIVVPHERSLSSYIQKDRNGERIGEIVNKFGKHNTDHDHPLLVLIGADGDNNGSNDRGFHSRVPMDLATRFPEKVVLTTIQDYLDIYPPEKPKLVSEENGVKKFHGGDVIHVEDGSWWGANLGDQQFSKWIDPPQYALQHYSPKNNSWAAITAAKNFALAADKLEPVGETKESVKNVITGKGTDSEKSMHNLCIAQTSCYEYWGPDDLLSYSSIIASNKAIDSAKKVLSRNGGKDMAGPSIFLPMQYPINPKGDVNILTYAYDLSGIKSVKVKYRINERGRIDKPEDFMFEGKGVKPFEHEVSMEKNPFPEIRSKPPVYVESKERADIYHVNICPPIPPGKNGALMQYYVEAVDKVGNVSRSPIQNIFVEAKANVKMK